MNIIREQREGGVSLLKITVNEADYGQAVENQLREYKRKANVPGFRPAHYLDRSYCIEYGAGITF